MSATVYALMTTAVAIVPIAIPLGLFGFAMIKFVK
jgi:hypothetical protein